MLYIYIRQAKSTALCRAALQDTRTNELNSLSMNDSLCFPEFILKVGSAYKCSIPWEQHPNKSIFDYQAIQSPGQLRLHVYTFLEHLYLICARYSDHRYTCRK